MNNNLEKLKKELLKKEKVNFDFDGEMQPDVALNPIYQEIYRFSKIVGKANILIMPALHSAAISTKLMKVYIKDKFFDEDSKNAWAKKTDCKKGDLLLIMAGEIDKTRKALGTLRLHLAEELGFSLGKLNYCLKALKTKGLIKIDNFTQIITFN